MRISHTKGKSRGEMIFDFLAPKIDRAQRRFDVAVERRDGDRALLLARVLAKAWVEQAAINRLKLASRLVH